MFEIQNIMLISALERNTEVRMVWFVAAVRDTEQLCLLQTGRAWGVPSVSILGLFIALKPETFSPIVSSGLILDKKE